MQISVHKKEFELDLEPPYQQGFYAQRLFKHLPKSLNNQDEVELETLLQLADGLIERVGYGHELDEIEELLESQPEKWPMAARVIVKLSRSKLSLRQRSKSLHLSVVVPLYAEHQRMMRSFEHTAGEDFINQKLRQMNWLCNDETSCTFEMILVDDGCPHGSGRLAEAILAQHHPDEPARVIYLEDAIAQNHPALASLGSALESQKGGAVHLGMWEAASSETDPHREHIVTFTDADLSTHLGQLGLLIEPLELPGVKVAAGSRRTRKSVVVKKSGRSARGRLFIYLWKKLLPELGYLDDTQCGFKALRADQVRALTASATQQGFTFDVELLLMAELMQRRSVAQVPIAWTDSDAASNTKSSGIHLSMLKNIASLSRRLGDKRAYCEAFSDAIERLNEDSWQKAIEDFGPLLENVDPILDGDAQYIQPKDIMRLQPA
ncbi:MAG: hypothetical protein CL917_05035 [Deltaproteobacteria bacterium]|nr:hypothetical protein [Deltaproteobacteria bacterium]